MSGYFAQLPYYTADVRCSTYNSTPPLESKLQALYLNKISHSKLEMVWRAKKNKHCEYISHLELKMFHSKAQMSYSRHPVWYSILQMLYMKGVCSIRYFECSICPPGRAFDISNALFDTWNAPFDTSNALFDIWNALFVRREGRLILDMLHLPRSGAAGALLRSKAAISIASHTDTSKAIHQRRHPNQTS